MPSLIQTLVGDKPRGLSGAFLDYGEAYPESAPWVGAVCAFSGVSPTPQEIIAEVGDKVRNIKILQAKLVHPPRGRWKWEYEKPKLENFIHHFPHRDWGIERAIEEINLHPPKLEGHLWRAWIIDGKNDSDDPEFFLYLQFHHSLMDGMSLTQLCIELLGTGRPRVPTGYRAPLLDAILGGLIVIGAQLGIPARTRIPVEGDSVQIQVTHLSLSELKRAKSRVDGTINDVVSAAVAVALYRCGIEGKVGVAVPVNVRNLSQVGKLGNFISTSNVLIHCNGQDVLQQAKRQSDKRRKALLYAQRGAVMSTAPLLSLFPASRGRYLIDGAFSPRSASIMLANLPPAIGELSIAGRPLKWIAGVNFLPRTHQLAITLSGCNDAITATVQHRVSEGKEDPYSKFIQYWREAVRELAEASDDDMVENNHGA